MNRNRKVKNPAEQSFKADRVKRPIGEKLGPEKAEEELRTYVLSLVRILNGMAEHPYRLALCQRPDDNFLHRIPLPVLYKLPTFIEYQGMIFPPQLLVSDMLFRDAIGRAVLNIKDLRKRVVIRLEKRGQRIRNNMFPHPATLEMKSVYDLERQRLEAKEQVSSEVVESVESSQFSGSCKSVESSEVVESEHA